jgi:hypothetical protein
MVTVIAQCSPAKHSQIQDVTQSVRGAEVYRKDEYAHGINIFSLFSYRSPHDPSTFPPFHVFFSVFSCCPHSLLFLKKTAKILSQDNRYRCRDLNLGLPEYETGVSTTRPRRSTIVVVELAWQPTWRLWEHYEPPDRRTKYVGQDIHNTAM